MAIFNNSCQVVEDVWIRYDRLQPIGRTDRIIAGIEDLTKYPEFFRRALFRLGIELEASASIEEIVDWLPRLELVILNFDSFADGRAFSQARVLRQRFSYQGDIRAQGEVLCDQLAFMQLCGINQFDMNEVEGLGQALNSISDIGETRQRQRSAG